MQQALALDRLRRRLTKGITFTAEEYPQEFLLTLTTTRPNTHRNRYKVPLGGLSNREREAYKDLFTLWKGEDSWKVDLTPPYGMAETESMRWVRAWLGRLQQALKDRGGGDVSAVIVKVPKPLTGKGVDFHYHAEVKAQGLSKIDKSRCEQKWNEMTSREVTVKDNPKLVVTYVPSAVRKRNGETTVLSKERRVSVKYSERKVHHGGGSCKIADITDGAPYYLASRKNLSTGVDQLTVWGRSPNL
jgi:hypothetical protein